MEHHAQITGTNRNAKIPDPAGPDAYGDISLPAVPAGYDQQQILSRYTAEEQQILKDKLRVLKVLACFIGKDYEMPVEFNQPGRGWHWDFEHNRIRIDPEDVLSQPLPYLRAIICHEGGHRRITRADFIPHDLWQTPGFSYLLNAIEDPRNDNFIAEAYPRYREDLIEAFSILMEREKRILEKTGETRPRFIVAGLEYIKYWFQEFQGLSPKLSEDMPDDMREVLEKTIADAREAWRYYPSKAEADRSEYVIGRYSRKAFRIIYERIWPEFQKLVEKDVHEKSLLNLGRDLLKRKSEEQNSNGGGSSLSGEDLQELKKALGGNKGGKSDQKMKPLSPELLDKLKEEYERLSEEEKEELKKKSKQALEELEKAVREELEGKLTEKTDSGQQQAAEDEKSRESETESHSSFEKYSQSEAGTRTQTRNLDFYREQRKQVAPQIRQFEQKIRKIFKERKKYSWESGFKGGQQIDIRHRIGEVARDVPTVQSKAWKKKVLPVEKDYAFGILVDLSGSMQGTRVLRALRAAITVIEPLQKLGISSAIYGFNSNLYEFKTFKEDLTPDTRARMGTMTAYSSGMQGMYTDDGWAINQLSAILSKQKAGNKCMIVITDGSTNPSPAHADPRYRLKNSLNTVHQMTDQVVIGLGIGSGTEFVDEMYQFGEGNISEDELPEVLARWLQDVIENGDRYQKMEKK